MSTSVPQEALAVYNRAFELAANGKREEAINEYRRALELYPNFVEAKNNIGELYAEADEIGEAIRAFEAALADSRDCRILFNLGVAYCKIGRDAEALDFFYEAIAQKPSFIEGNYYAGLLLYNKNDYAQAEGHLVKVVAQEPKHIKTNYLLSHIYYEQKQYDKVLECLNRIRDIAEDQTFINRYFGFCHYHLGSYKLAAQYLTSALETHPAYERFKDYIAGLTYENKMREIGDIDKAIAELEVKVMQSEKPRLSDASRLSMMYIFKGENSKAESMLLNFKNRMFAASAT